jgi:signal transduction histidine kinase
VRASIELSARPGPPLDPERESAVYRIVQEALTNVERHGRAEGVEVVVAERAGEIEIRVEDDGVGFDTRVIPGGFGLRGMRERAESAGGRLTVGSDPGAGTRVRATIPSARPTGAGILDRNAGLEGI